MGDEKTPPAVLVTPAEKDIARGALRTFIKAVAPHLPEIAKYAGPALVGFMLTTAHTWAQRDEVDQQTKTAYKKLAEPVNDHAAEIDELRKAVAQLADTVQVQGRLLLASRPGFTPTGQPETAAAAVAPSRARKRRAAVVPPPADPKLVKQVRDNAVKGLEALKVQVKEASPPPKTAPATLDSQSPAPLPQIRDAGHSP